MNVSRIILFSLFISFGYHSTLAQTKNELAIGLDPLATNNKMGWNLLYKRNVGDFWQMRSWLGLAIQTSKMARTDTVQSHSGSIKYDLAIGIQRNLTLGDLKYVHLYAGSDIYLSSEFSKQEHESYYGYYYTFGLNPLVGVSSVLAKNFSISLEGLSNLNIGNQQYAGTGANYDKRISFNPAERLRLSVGYLF